jgi:HSP20 family protein
MQSHQPYSTGVELTEQPVLRRSVQRTGSVPATEQRGTEEPIQQSSPFQYGLQTGQPVQQSNGPSGVQQPIGTGFSQGQRAAEQVSYPTWTGRQQAGASQQQPVSAVQAPSTSQRGVAASPGRVTSLPEFVHQQPMQGQGALATGATTGRQFASPQQFGQQGAQARTGVAAHTAGAQAAGTKTAETQQMTQDVESEGRAQQQLAPEQPKPATSPYVDVFDNPDELLVVADLPGCGPEDVDLQVSNNALRIVGERKSESEDLENHAIQRERLTRAERVIELPTNVEADEAEASCDHGVVRIHLPKAEEDREKHIGVQ